MTATQQTRLIGTVADNIRRLRKNAHMTQTDLALAAGISRASVAQIEGQRYSSFTLATLEGIAAALGVQPEILLKQKAIVLTACVQEFMHSPWATALKPSDEEIKLLSQTMTELGFSENMPPSILAEFVQLLRRMQHSAFPAG